MQHNTGIELAATRTHWQPVERSTPHRRRDRNPVPHRTSRAAIAEMRHNNTAIGDFGGTPRKNRGDVFVGEAVKAVAPDTLFVKGVGQRKGLLDLGCSAMKSRV